MTSFLKPHADDTRAFKINVILKKRLNAKSERDLYDIVFVSVEGVSVLFRDTTLKQILIECLPNMYVKVPMYPAEPFVPWNLF